MNKREEEENQEEHSTVIHKGEARLIVSGSEESVVPSAEPRAIRPEPREVASPQREKDLRDLRECPSENVARLERASNPGKERIKVAKAKFEKLEPRPDEAEVQESQWGGAKVSGGRTLLIGGLVVILLVVGLVVLRGFFDGGVAKVETVPALVVEKESDPYEGNPEKWFREHSGNISVPALAVLKGFMNAEDDQARSQWVRHPSEYLKQCKDWPVPVNPLLSTHDPQEWEIGHTEETAYLILNARDHDYLPFRAYFTRENGELKLDWAATTAWSEVSLQTIRQTAQRLGGPVNEAQRKAGVVALSQLSPAVKSVLPDKIHTDSVFIRCQIRKKEEFYAGPYNDQEHSAYMLLSADQMHHMWGYAPKGSELDLKLKALLDHGSFVVALKKDQRVILRVRMNKKDALPSQLELVELITPEWVTP